ncbi:MAG TPA: hypothetical protein VFW92_07985 [Candidatus Limnocylindrales bacterium]|nr:hypothetical protein [Candidatus Limnocylindrales bacterium]
MNDWSAADPKPHGANVPGAAPSHLVAEPPVADAAAFDAPRYPQPTIGGGSGPGTYMAMPRLMGAPAYSRPPRPVVAATPRPFDPDDLPIEAWRSGEEREIAEAAALAWEERRLAADRGPVIQPSSNGGLRGIAARLLRAGS